MYVIIENISQKRIDLLDINNKCKEKEHTKVQ
jgi:hypothetical protein